MANILIADDEKEIVRLLRMYIEANDNIVFEANDGQEALRILDKENIDLAIVDIMPFSWKMSRNLCWISFFGK